MSEVNRLDMFCAFYGPYARQNFGYLWECLERWPDTTTLLAVTLLPWRLEPPSCRSEEYSKKHTPY